MSQKRLRLSSSLKRLAIPKDTPQSAVNDSLAKKATQELISNIRDTPQRKDTIADIDRIANQIPTFKKEVSLQLQCQANKRTKKLLSKIYQNNNNQTSSEEFGRDAKKLGDSFQTWIYFVKKYIRIDQKLIKTLNENCEKLKKTLSDEIQINFENAMTEEKNRNTIIKINSLSESQFLVNLLQLNPLKKKLKSQKRFYQYRKNRNKPVVTQQLPTPTSQDIINEFIHPYRQKQRQRYKILLKPIIELEKIKEIFPKNQQGYTSFERTIGNHLGSIQQLQREPLGNDLDKFSWDNYKRKLFQPICNKIIRQLQNGFQTTIQNIEASQEIMHEQNPQKIFINLVKWMIDKKIYVKDQLKSDYAILQVTLLKHQQRFRLNLQTQFVQTQNEERVDNSNLQRGNIQDDNESQYLHQNPQFEQSNLIFSSQPNHQNIGSGSQSQSSSQKSSNLDNSDKQKKTYTLDNPRYSEITNERAKRQLLKGIKQVHQILQKSKLEYITQIFEVKSEQNDSFTIYEGLGDQKYSKYVQNAQIDQNGVIQKILQSKHQHKFILQKAMGIQQSQKIGIFHADINFRNTIYIKRSTEDNFEGVYNVIDFDKSYSVLKGMQTKQFFRSWLNDEQNKMQLIDYIFDISGIPNSTNDQIQRWQNYITKQQESIKFLQKEEKIQTKISRCMKLLSMHMLKVHLWHFKYMVNRLIDFKRCSLYQRNNQIIKNALKNLQLKVNHRVQQMQHQQRLLDSQYANEFYSQFVKEVQQS